jgi:hypothetical protein
MRVEVNVLESGRDPRVSVQHQPALMMALRTGSLEVGSRCSEMWLNFSTRPANFTQTLSCRLTRFS